MPEIRGCQFPDEYAYDADCNLWFAPVDHGEYRIGVTAYGAVLVGDIYMFNPKRVGRLVEVGEAFALIEVAKTILPMKAPFELTITETNDVVQNQPFLINRAPYESWLVQVALTDQAQAESLLCKGAAMIEKAHASMDSNRFTSLAEFEAERKRS